MAATPRRDSGRSLTPEEKERSIEMHLRGVPVREVAKTIPTTTRTVVETFKSWCASRTKEFADEIVNVANRLLDLSDNEIVEMLRLSFLPRSDG